MNPKTKQMYQEMYDILYRRFHHHEKTIDALTEFIAVDNCPALLNQLDHKLEWVYDDPELCQSLDSVYNLDLLKADAYDYLGDLYLGKQRNDERKHKGQYLLPERVVGHINGIVISKTDEKVNILDPYVGTGRFLISAHKYAPNANLFGVDIDLRALRIAFTNCAIQNIKAYLLHADNLVHEIDVSKADGSYNWQFANRWYSCMDKLQKACPDRVDESKTEVKKKTEELVQLKPSTISKTL
jgi:type I restriction-modification system DNA methylase subunit